MIIIWSYWYIIIFYAVFLGAWCNRAFQDYGPFQFIYGLLWPITIPITIIYKFLTFIRV
jgi:hypothetical protein